MIKITDPHIIQKREQELLGAITDSLDRNALVDVLKEQHRLHTISGMDSQQGDIVAIDDRVVYRLDFNVRTVLSVLFDRSGNYVEMPSGSPAPLPIETAPVDGSAPADQPADTGASAEDDPREPQDDDPGEYFTLDQILTTKAHMITDSPPTPDKESRPQPSPDERMTRMASDLADMISDINGQKT